MTMSAQRRSAVQLTERAAGPFGAGTGQNTHGERETRRDGLPVRGAVLLASTGPASSVLPVLPANFEGRKWPLLLSGHLYPELCEG